MIMDFALFSRQICGLLILFFLVIVWLTHLVLHNIVFVKPGFNSPSNFMYQIIYVIKIN